MIKFSAILSYTQYASVWHNQQFDKIMYIKNKLGFILSLVHKHPLLIYPMILITFTLILFMYSMILITFTLILFIYSMILITCTFTLILFIYFMILITFTLILFIYSMILITFTLILLIYSMILITFTLILFPDWVYFFVARCHCPWSTRQSPR